MREFTEVPVISVDVPKDYVVIVVGVDDYVSVTEFHEKYILRDGTRVALDLMGRQYFICETNEE